MKKVKINLPLIIEVRERDEFYYVENYFQDALPNYKIMLEEVSVENNNFCEIRPFKGILYIIGQEKEFNKMKKSLQQDYVDEISLIKNKNIGS